MPTDIFHSIKKKGGAMETKAMISGEGLARQKKGIRRWIRKRRRAVQVWWGSHSLLGGKVSRLHFHEAKERYHSLRCIIENNVRKYVELPDEDEYDSLEQACKDAIQKCSIKFADKREDLEKCIRLLADWKTLVEIKRFISRRPEHLNNLWRTMTRIRIDLMEDGFLSNEPSRHRYFCKEEAYRLGVREDPEIKEMLEKLGDEGVSGQGLSEQFLGTYRALLERFNTIRTGRIHQQYINVKIYTRALIMLIIFMIPVLLFGEIFLHGTSGSEDQGTAIQALLTHNSLAFVFFSGFLGGLFSVAMRERPIERKPGEDAYQSRYIVTKPFIGAAAARFMYILVIGGVLKTDLIANPDGLKAIGPLTFGFAFIAGFTERLVFPSFR
jgi:nitroreductase